MKFKFLILITVCFLATLFVCESGNNKELTIKLKNEPVVATLEYDHTMLKDKVVIQGVLKIETQGHKIANLRCLKLKSSKVEVRDIYVNSIAHISPSNYKLQNKEERIEVYWVLPEDSSKAPISNFFLVVSSDCQLLIK